MIISAEITPDVKNIRNSSWKTWMDEGPSDTSMNTGSGFDSSGPAYALETDYQQIKKISSTTKGIEFLD